MTNKIEGARQHLEDCEKRVKDARQNEASLRMTIAQTARATTAKGVGLHDASQGALERLRDHEVPRLVREAALAQRALDDVRRQRHNLVQSIGEAEASKAAWGPIYEDIMLALGLLEAMYGEHGWPHGLTPQAIRGARISLQNRKRDWSPRGNWAAQLAEYGDDPTYVPPGEPPAWTQPGPPPPAPKLRRLRASQIQRELADMEVERDAALEAEVERSRQAALRARRRRR